MTLDFFDAEMENAPRQRTGALFHYTNAEAAIFGILRSGTLRLSPFETTNDPWESKPAYPAIAVHHDDRDHADNLQQVWAQIDRSLRLHAKVACLTQDWTFLDPVLDPDALRGWNRLATWAHYGGRHSGICLRFDQEALVRAFESTPAPGALLRFHGPVQYIHAATPTLGMDLGQIREFGVDAAAVVYARANAEQIFFRKHRDWSNEMEYRLVLVDQSVLPAEIPISAALTGVFLGADFPKSRRPVLRAALEPYPHVEVLELFGPGRSLRAAPIPRVALVDDSSVAPPRRDGTVEERIAALDACNVRAAHLREAAEKSYTEPAQDLMDALMAIAEVTCEWPKTDVTVGRSTTAVPESQRSRQPGVPGEVVHLETGSFCTVQSLPAGGPTLVAAAALQVLDDDRVRLHAVVRIEEPHPEEGIRPHDHWRTAPETTRAEAVTAIRQVAGELLIAVGGARAAFDELREQAR
ncbi:hypothetical protein Ade02nite_69850 [Paractinoplanes deccanensis]|uniref:DUF2971 domain-containing protein n=1 Tax=Paractinoplanes deccanensis TaxID=113561 RepID=A0ABQ3YEC7_9ACTN|nr:DUF2971 domain-containing protein [Actinoplanes deccanensis]GID78344.1 hypothetical protein Ade02nite_69850 [Actinoplanes deccanensis]